jgi:hypothetical protein
MNNSVILSNIWFPLRDVIAMYRKRPSSTAVGMYASGYGTSRMDSPIRM